MAEASALEKKLDVFISYSRHDAATADALVEVLSARGFRVAIDRRDLEFGEKWQAELAEFIRLSDTVIWLVSEASIKSDWVNWELDEVVRRNKRLVPVMVGNAARDTLPRQLGEIHILPAEGVFQPARDLDELVRVLETDRPWLREGSRLADRAHEWLGKSRTTALLLRGAALHAAEQWKDRRPAKAPAPAQEVLELILASRQSSIRRQRWWIAGSLAVAAGAVALAGLAYVQRLAADRQRDQALTTQSLFFADLASQKIGQSDAGTGILLAIEVLPDTASGIVRPYVSEAGVQLDRGFRAMRELAWIEHDIEPGSTEGRAAFSADGRRVVTMQLGLPTRLWDASTGKELAELPHDYRVNAAAFSGDGTRVVTASLDKTARIWDAATGKELARLSHDGEVNSATFSDDGTRVMTASQDTTARLWDAVSGKELARFSHPGGVYSAALSREGTRVMTMSSHDAISRDGQRILSTSSQDRSAWVWDAAGGQELGKIAHDPQAPIGLQSFNPDGTRLMAVLGFDRNVALVWDPASGKELTRLSHGYAINTAMFSGDGMRIATASQDKTARVWDATSGKELARLGHDGAVYSAAFSRDGTRVVTASEDKTARVWDAVAGRELMRLSHDRAVAIAAFSDDGARVVTSSDEIVLWDASTGTQLARFGEFDGMKSLRFTADGTRLVAESATKVVVWDIGDRKEPILLEHDARVDFATFNRDGTRLLTAAQDGKARIWEAASGKELVQFAHRSVFTSPVFSPDETRVVTASDNTAQIWDSVTGAKLVGVNHDDWILGAAFNSDGTRLVTASKDSTARIWDATTGRELMRLAHGFEVHRAAFLNDGTRVMTISGDGIARVWDTTATGKELSSLNLGSFQSIAVSGDATRVVTGYWVGSAKVWDIPSARLLTTPVPTAQVHSVDITRDGTHVLTVQDGNAVHVWNADSAKEIAVFARDGTLASTRFNTDGTRVATAMAGGPAQIWDVASGKEQAQLGSQEQVAPGAFSRDGRSFVTLSGPTARLWHIFSSTQDLVDAAKARAPRCLTAAQRKAYFLPETPPFWCVKRGLWPYGSKAWRNWLVARKDGKDWPLPPY